MTVAAIPARPSMFAVFRKRYFSLLWTAQLVSTIGSSLTNLAAGIYVFRVTGSAFSVGLMLMATALPSLFVGLIAGVFVDRFDRKKILIASDLLRAGLVASIPIFIGINVVLLYVVVLVNASVKQFFDPAQESILPDIASDEELAAANSFLSISSFGSTAVGFAAAGLLAASFDIEWAFWLDSLTFLFSAACVLFVHVQRTATAEKSSIAVVGENLREGLRYLVGSERLRALFLVGAPVFFSIGLWNVLLLPFATRALHATEFEYGLQEGLTSVGFVIGSLLMARVADRLREGSWMVVSFTLMGAVGLVYSVSTSIPFALVLVMLAGFFNAPSSIARRLALQRSVPRELRGRVFSAFFVARDVLFLVGMVTAGLADVIDVRILVALSSVILVGAAVLTQLTPGLGTPAAEWRRSMQLLRTAPTGLVAAAVRPATAADFDRLVGHIAVLGLLDEGRRATFIARATVADAAAGATIVKQGDPGDSAYFVLDGRLVAGTPDEETGFRALSSMTAGDFFGEIAALTGSPRTANVVVDESATLLEVPAETLRSLMAVPQLSQLFLSKLTERLVRTSSADLPRLAGIDQETLRDLRTRQPSAEALPKTYGAEV